MNVPAGPGHTTRAGTVVPLISHRGSGQVPIELSADTYAFSRWRHRPRALMKLNKELGNEDHWYDKP